MAGPEEVEDVRPADLTIKVLKEDMDIVAEPLDKTRPKRVSFLPDPEASEDVSI